ncbi:unnamed protein product [Owenia fusiformis]|uniref:G-protein coupled receptors family 1 profile domain-containing protein n=1 Tax=Owenia fusiformis TaxID=6347 RepID=A0A8S4NQ29_OWEFU|nr:unnamed protein product [Owenia fusiformis]
MAFSTYSNTTFGKVITAQSESLIVQDGESTTVPLTQNNTSTNDSAFYNKAISYGLGSLGFCGNILVVFVFMNSRIQRRKITNMLIINQSTVDMLASLFVILNNLFDDHGVITEPGLAAELYCMLWLSQYTLWSNMTVSTFNLMALTFERYFAVIHPFTYKLKFTRKKAALAICLVWLCGLTFSSINIWTTYLEGTTCKLYAGYPSELFRNVCGVVTVSVMVFVPVGILIGCYIRIAMEIYRQAKMTDASSHRDTQMSKAKINVIRTLLLVSVCFFICWITNGTYYLLYSLGVLLNFESPVYKPSVIASYANCCINPFIYVFSYDAFKGALKEASGCTTSEEQPSTSTISNVSN